MRAISDTLLVAVAAQLTGQLIKVVLHSVRTRSLQWHYFVNAGGFPSAHSAFSTALLVGIAFRSGLDSDLFAVAAVFSAIVIYDAYRLRGAVQNQAKMLNKILRERGEPEVSELSGHSLAEIIVGVILGATIATAYAVTVGAP